MNSRIYPLKLYLKHLPNVVMIGLSILFNIATWAWILFRLGPQDELIFLHYNILFGVDLIGEWQKILFLPLVGLCIFIINTVLGWVVFRRDSFAAYTLLAMSVFCQAFLLIASGLLVFLNV